MDEELHLHLLELAGAKDEVAWRNLVTKRFADLSNAERRLLTRGVEHVLEVEEDSLCRFGTQIDIVTRTLDRTGLGFEHEVELAGLGESARLATRWAGVRVVEVVLAMTGLAVGAVDERIAEVGEVARRLPDRWGAKHRGIEADDVVAHLYHRAPPCVLDVAKH